MENETEKTKALEAEISRLQQILLLEQARSELLQQQLEIARRQAAEDLEKNLN